MNIKLLFFVLLGSSYQIGHWIPLPKSSFYVAYGTAIKQRYSQAIADVDGEAVTENDIIALHRSQTRVICYFSAGTYENWRKDKSMFTKQMLGKNVSGWKGEKWLNIRLKAVRNIIVARMKSLKRKGCDGVDPDNVDGYQNKNGFKLTAADQLDYNKFIATTAHQLGLAVGLKNDVDQIKELEPYFDFAFNEECEKYNECGSYKPFVSNNKLVMGTFYSGNGCSDAIKAGINALSTNTDLTGKQTACSPGLKSSVTFKGQ